jgi:hypothetical protein
VVKVRLRPQAGDNGKIELALEVFLDAGLDAHAWRIHFMAFATEGLSEGQPGVFADVWDLMLEMWIPRYSPEVYVRFAPLFDEALLGCCARFDRLLQICPDALPPEFRAMLVRANRHLQLQRYVHARIPQMFAPGTTDEQVHRLYYATFSEVVRTFRTVAREADRQREAATAATTTTSWRATGRATSRRVSPPSARGAAPVPGMGRPLPGN